jgi:hypothetical protein
MDGASQSILILVKGKMDSGLRRNDEEVVVSRLDAIQSCAKISRIAESSRL